MKTKTKTNKNPLTVLTKTSGKFTSVTYTNAANVTKNYTVRTGVTKYIKGSAKRTLSNAITVFCVDSNKSGYKTFKRTGIKRIKCGRVLYRRG